MVVPDPMSIIFKIYKICTVLTLPHTQPPASAGWKSLVHLFSSFIN